MSHFLVSFSGTHSEGIETTDEILTLTREWVSQLTGRGLTVETQTVDLSADPPTVAADAPEAAPEPDEAPSGDLTLAERVSLLQQAAGDAHMSQRELSEALGVSRYQIRKALGKV